MLEKRISIDIAEGPPTFFPTGIAALLDQGGEISRTQFEEAKAAFDALKLMMTPPSDEALECLKGLIAARTTAEDDLQ